RASLVFLPGFDVSIKPGAGQVAVTERVAVADNLPGLTKGTQLSPAESARGGLGHVILAKLRTPALPSRRFGGFSSQAIRS
ncbi:MULTISPECIES: hypothetical protein, partial [unclassified Micromonospora]|uniref:hypothetical protein n=1 Tax=unclassified Micromonospora TaxID=2617518 RepID=UPI003A8BB758